jgi:hypothetical protein
MASPLFAENWENDTQEALTNARARVAAFIGGTANSQLRLQLQGVFDTLVQVQDSIRLFGAFLLVSKQRFGMINHPQSQVFASLHFLINPMQLQVTPHCIFKKLIQSQVTPRCQVPRWNKGRNISTAVAGHAPVLFYIIGLFTCVETQIVSRKSLTNTCFPIIRCETEMCSRGLRPDALHLRIKPRNPGGTHRFYPDPRHS